MDRLPDELRLLILIAINAMVLITAVRFMRRRGVRDVPQVALDAMLLWYVVQYVSVGLPGMIGALSTASMLAVAIVASIAISLIPSNLKGVSHRLTSNIERRAVLACCAMLLAFEGAVIWTQRFVPPTANDALTYHLPAAVQWLQTGQIGVFRTWYFNPANAYSPLAGSAFIAWLLAPLHNDALAQFVEAPALLMIFLALLQLCRALGASVVTASLIALAACAARPFISQTVLTKDDLFVTAFFGAAVASLARENLSDSLGTLRFGAALGLLLATKYTALMSVPILLLAFDAPRGVRWRGRQYITAGLVTVLLAGPWYLRNVLLTRNPLFPVDLPGAPGMFTIVRSSRLGGAGGIWSTLVHSYASLPQLIAIALLVLWVVAMVRRRKTLMRSPLERLVLIGPMLGIALFAGLSPYAEVRFVYPSFLLLFTSAAIALGWMDRRWIGIALTAALVALCVMTSFVPAVLRELALPAIIVVAVTLAVIAVIDTSLRSRHRDRITLVASGALALVLFGFVYVFWQAHLNSRRDSERDFWGRTYGLIADAWEFLREKEMPAGTVVAYANSYCVYPLSGRQLDRRIVYAPTRPGVRTMSDLGRINQPVRGEDIATQVTELMLRDPDREVWLKNLRSSGAKFLVIKRSKPQPPPVEWVFAQNDARFVVIFENLDAVIYEVRW